MEIALQQEKLKAEDRRLLALKLDDLAFSCGASLQDLDFPAPLNEVFVRSVNCFNPIEKLYYSAGYEPICLYCAGQVDTATESIQAIIHNAFIAVLSLKFQGSNSAPTIFHVSAVSCIISQLCNCFCTTHNYTCT